MNDRSLIRMEKRATNHIGLFFVFLLTAIGLGVGGYLLYKNKDNLELTLPWEKIDYDDEEMEPIIDDKEDNTSGGKLFLPEINPETNIIPGNDYMIGLYVSKMTATEKGYEVTFELKYDKNAKLPEESLKTGDIKLKCSKILVDKYEVTPKFELTYNKDTKNVDSTTVTIPIMELQNLEIQSFNNLYLFVKLDWEDPFEGKKTQQLDGLITAYQDFNVNNTKKIVKSYSSLNKVRISYYKKIEAEDATYLYFQAENNHQIDTQEIQLKKCILQ